MVVCPLADLILQSNETVSLGMSSLRTDPPMDLQTHLQSHSWDVMEAGAGNSESAICEYKKYLYYYRINYNLGIGLSILFKP